MPWGRKVPGHEDGFFTGVTLFDKAHTAMRVYREVTQVLIPVQALRRVITQSLAPAGRAESGPIRQRRLDVIQLL